MRLLKVLGIVAVVCIACATVMFLGGAQLSRTTGAAAVGEEMGHTLGLFLMSAIPTSIVFWLRRNNVTVRYAGLGTGICASLVLALSMWVGSPQGQRAVLGESVATSETWSVYAPKGCGYEVRFPKKPDVSRKQHYVGGKWFELERAEYGDRGGYLRVECLMFHLTPVMAEAMAKGYVQSEGLQKASVAEISPSVIEAKGTKTVENKEVTVVSRVHHGRVATLTLLVMTAPSQYPTWQSRGFFGSVKGIRDQDRPFLMDVVFKSHGQQEVPIGEKHAYRGWRWYGTLARSR